MYYWKIYYDNGTVEYWKSKNSCHNFKKMTNPKGIKIKYAKPITKLVYLFSKWKHKQNFTITLN